MQDFRKDTMYFIVVDRFFDGDTQNDHGKNPAQFDPERKNWMMYWGGDLEGIIQKMDYIAGLGASAVWITPVFDQIDDVIGEDGKKMAPYHGYWAQDFKRIDEHLVDRPDDVRVFSRNDTVFDRMVAEMHRRGIKLVLDIVCNHSSPHVVGGTGDVFDDGVRIASYDEDLHGWYHRAGEVRDWRNLQQVQDGDLCGLSDFNEESHDYRSYIKEAMRMWLDKGTDAFRVDTVKHMPMWFWQEFTSDMRRHSPDMFMFGEWFMGGAYDGDSVRFARSSGMSMIDFSLRQAMEEVFARDVYRGFDQLADLFKQDHLFLTASELVTFVDNHDLPRFLSIKNDPARFRMANALVMTARGIPCIYYGTEQLLHDDAGGGNDPYNRPMMASWDTTAPLYRDLRALADLRRRNVAVQKGGMFVRQVTPDVFIFARRYMGSSVVVAMNKGNPAVVSADALPLADATYACVLTGRKVAARDGMVKFDLGKNDVWVLEQTVPPPKGNTVCEFQLNGISTQFGEDIFLTGDCPELGEWDIGHAVKMEYVNQNTWCVDVPFNISCDNEVAYKFFLKSQGGIQRENALPRVRAIPPAGTARFRDDWTR
ncbi:MAG: cyclomaltodextrin glucanotransferase [Deltaproteobacteria bacterium]|nr:cyclomaltodextrin glucanotransferase [Deltaproteobacteria bacterium]